ncbi:hypothetical protein MRB53_033553 [Persea americana]|uniref:Uncharacterized protein n=1 Tax=Persea americana TaxID=3435 RepID=A0ACC2KV85_PERAE|nr:hypothetical protein MRB53_033553 [Persea americana]
MKGTGFLPRIFGHEASGMVESVGEKVEEVKEGDFVVSVFLPNCGECIDCKSEKGNMCCRYPTRILPGMRDGTKKACLLSCGVSTGIGASWKVAGVTPGSTVAIFGLGAIGLAEHGGFGEQMGQAEDLGVGREGMGAGSKEEETEQSDKFEAEDWGQTIILGVEMHGSPIPVNSSAILRGKTMKGALFGGLKAKSDIPLLVKINKDKELHLDEFVTHEVGLRDINKAFDLLLQGKSLRCIIWMDK